MFTGSQILGLVLAFVSMVLFGLYMVPRSHTTVSQPRFMLFMGAGTMASSLALGALFGGNLAVAWDLRLWAIAGGVVWGFGTVAYSTGVQKIGLSRSTPIKNTTAILGTLYGVLIFREFTLEDPAALVMAFAGSASIVLAAVLLGAVTSPAEQHVPVPRGTFWAGVALSLTAAVCYSFYAIPLRHAVHAGLSPVGFLFYMGQGAFVGMAGAALLARRPSSLEDLTLEGWGAPVLAGVLWAAASACCNSAIKLVGLSIAWPIGNLNTLVAVAYGSWVLHEVRVREHRRELFWGLTAATAGVFLLAVAMAR